MAGEKLVVVVGDRPPGPGVRMYTGAGWAAAVALAREFLGDYHRQFPLRTGAPKEELRSRMGMTPQTFNDVMPRFRDEGVLVEEGTLVRAADHQPGLTAEDQKLTQAYIELLEASPYSPPSDSSIDAELLNLLSDQGRVVKASESVVFAASAYNEMADRISAHIKERGEITVADVRDMFGTSRKYALAIMDHLDHQRITRRVGDVRVLR